MRARRLHESMILVSLLGLCLSTPPLFAQKFYSDDPLEKEPPPMPVMDAEPRELSELLEWASGQFGAPGERHPEIGVIPGMGVNTLGEVMDGAWFQNRHGKKRMTLEELVLEKERLEDLIAEREMAASEAVGGNPGATG